MAVTAWKRENNEWMLTEKLYLATREKNQGVNEKVLTIQCSQSTQYVRQERINEEAGTRDRG